MKLTVDKKECGKVFYNEILYISSKYPLLKKNPNTKAHSVTKVFSIYITIGFLMMVAFHELTHEHQHNEAERNNNSSSAMSYIIKKLYIDDIINSNFFYNIIAFDNIYLKININLF